MDFRPPFRPGIGLLRLVALVLPLALLAPPAAAQAPRVHALVGATLVPAPGQVVEGATVVLRDGRIVAAGPAARVAIPADARRWEMDGRWVYAGFVDPYVELEAPEEGEAAEGDPGAPGPGSEHLRLRGELDVAEGLSPDPELLEGLRKAGYTAAVVAYDGGVLRGRAAAIALGGGDPRDMLIAPRVAMAASLAGSGWGSREYPGSVMGAVAAFRQALLDADHYRADHAHYERNRQRRARPAHDAQLEALQPVIAGEMPVLMPLRGVTLPYRADIVARELGEIGPKLVFVNDNAQWERPDMVPRHPHILTLDFPQLPKLEDEHDFTQLSLDWLRQWDWAPSNAALVDSLGVPFAFTSHDLDDRGQLLARVRRAHARGLSANSALAALTTRPATFFGLGGLLGTVEAGKAGHLTVLRGGDLLHEDAVVEMVFVDGVPHWVDRPGDEPADDADEGKGKGKGKKKDEEKDGPEPRIAAREQDYKGPFASPSAVLFRGATLWTLAGDGVVEGDLLVRDGRIAAIGEGLEAPRGAMVVDATGRHLTPGLIDAHSHSAAFGGINEGIPLVSSEVRIRDVVTAEDRGIYQQLAGGLTTAHVMHGSANSIGGQNATLTFRWGADPEGLLMPGVPPTIKFALGENPRGANSSARERRYPDTRMGVEEIIRSSFAAARDYAAAREAARRDGKLAPVARDLRLEALVEVLEGQRLVHSHSYVGPEILMLMRAFEEQGAKVAVFQHVLEGYKVADEMAAHGAGASTFSDWWAYKYEVIDAIGYNAAIMDERGVVVSLNSDSGDLARRLNTEAAKAVRYGGTGEEAALAMVTLNPAKQLRIDDRVGSLEVGKQADLALWSDHPLSALAVADQTWIAGELYWDRELDAERQARRSAEYEALMARARGDDDGGDEDDENREDGEAEAPEEAEPGPEVSR